MKASRTLQLGLLGVILGAGAVGWIVGYQPVRSLTAIFLNQSGEMVIILPLALILISLFEQWIKREAVEKHLGEGAGPLAFLWAVLLGGAIVGPMIVALPVASALYRKGASLEVILTYVGSATVCRIPMTVFEASYLGGAFTAVRYGVSIPLIILTSILLGRILKKRGFSLPDPEAN